MMQTRLNRPQREPQPLNQPKAALSQVINTLTPRDASQIIRFSSNASQLGNQPLPATTDKLQNVLRWLTERNAGSGTQMIEGIKPALDFPQEEGRFRHISFLTDSFISNEQQALTTLYHKRGTSPILALELASRRIVF